MKKLIFILIILFSSLVNASTLTTETQTELDTTLSNLQSETLAGNAGYAVDIMPPSFFQYLANKTQKDKNEIKQMLKEKAVQLAGEMKIHRYDYDLKRSTEHTVNHFKYAIIPTTLDMEIGSKKLTVNNYLLGIKENNDWYFLNWQDHQIPVFKQIYPELENIELPK